MTKKLALLIGIVVMSIVIPMQVRSETRSEENRVALNADCVIVEKSEWGEEAFRLRLKNYKNGPQWMSKNKKVATVDKKGNVDVHKCGMATIVAKAGEKEYCCKVMVIRANYGLSEVRLIKRLVQMQRKASRPSKFKLNLLEYGIYFEGDENTAGETFEYKAETSCVKDDGTAQRKVLFMQDEEKLYLIRNIPDSFAKYSLEDIFMYGSSIQFYPKRIICNINRILKLTAGKKKIMWKI